MKTGCNGMMGSVKCFGMGKRLKKLHSFNRKFVPERTNSRVEKGV